MPGFFKQSGLDKKKKMEIIREEEAKTKDFLEGLLKQKRKELLSKGYTEERADEIIAEIKDEVSRKAAILFHQLIREGEKSLRQTQAKK